MQLSEEAAYTPGELNAYDKYRDSVRREKTLFLEWFHEGIGKGMAEGLAKGLAKGMAKGMAEGMAEGLAKGMEKGMATGMEKGLEKGMEKGLATGMEKGVEQSKKEVALKMLKAKRSIEEISLFTDLSRETIQTLIDLL